MKNGFKPLAGLLLGMALFWPATFALAAGVETGVNQVNSNIVLSATSPIVVATKIVNLVMMFLGIIAVSLVIYGGFVWMTSNGREERIETAKKILKNALIGLIIILSSWGIAAFVLSRLAGGSGGGGGANNNQNTINNSQFGLGAVGACVVENFFPSAERSNVPRNSAIMVTFKEEVDPNSVCTSDGNPKNACACSNACNHLNPEAIQIFRTDVGNKCGESGCDSGNTNLTNATVGLSFDKKTIVVIPKEYLGDANVAVPYGVRFSDRVNNKAGKNIFGSCRPNYLEWNFTVNGLVDLVPPMVSVNGVFPTPDNAADTVATANGQSAVATITLKRAVAAEQAVVFDSVASDGTAVPLGHFTLSNNYQEVSGGAKDVFVITAVDQVNAFKISSGGKLLGSVQASKDSTGVSTVTFPNFFSFDVKGFQAGNSWTVTITKPHPADELIVGSQHLSFGNSSATAAATAIGTFLNGAAIKSSLNLKSVSVVSSTVTITANPGEQSGALGISSVRPDAMDITQFSGGANGGEKLTTKDKPDQPMNSALQVNFSKELNPLTIAGPADYVSSTIYVVNADGGKGNGKDCSKNGNSDCLSEKCDQNGKTCVGDYVEGTFALASDYKTLEFLSDNQCGVNGCGEKIYCLPASSHLKVILMAADLEQCTTNDQCVAKAPFATCSAISSAYSASPYKSCAKSDAGPFYPTADIMAGRGIFDASGNSFDGNRNAFTEGSFNTFNENVGDKNNGDNFSWSFFISDQMVTDAPQILSIDPSYNSKDTNANLPITIQFNRLMLNSSLVTGSTVVSNGNSTVTHKCLNIRSFGNPAGYWVSSNNICSDLTSGVLDRTTVKINHSVFSAASSFSAQAGSGLRDIYQNCFKPSGGAGCQADSGSSSCCSGSPTALSGLTADGNCSN